MEPTEAPAELLGGVILAGGRGLRLPDKCFRKLAGKELIAHVFGKISEVTSEIVVTVKSREQANRVHELLPEARIVLDNMAKQSPLVGLLTGLRAVERQYVFVAPCDTPFIEPKVVGHLLLRALSNNGAVVVRDENMFEPLCAVYRRESTMSTVEKSLEDGRMSMLEMLERVGNLARVPIEEIKKLDPNLLTFRNINTAEDFVWAEQTIRDMART